MFGIGQRLGSCGGRSNVRPGYPRVEGELGGWLGIGAEITHPGRRRFTLHAEAGRGQPARCGASLDIAGLGVELGVGPQLLNRCQHGAARRGAGVVG